MNFKHWDDAALACTRQITIAANVLPGAGIADIRKTLDLMIDSGAGQWTKFGAQAYSLASGWALVPSDPERAAEVITALLVRKQTDYGHENIARFGEIGLFVRLHDKVARLENLLATGKAPENESVTDNLMDVIGYAVIGEMWMRGLFLLPLRSTVAESTTVS